MAEQQEWTSFVQHLRQGRLQEVEQFLREYGPAVHRIVRNRWAPWLARREDCQDLCQSIFRTIFRRLRAGEFEIGDSHKFIGLIFAIAQKKVAKKARFHQADCRDPRKEAHRTSASGGQSGLPFDPVDPDPSPAEKLEMAELIQEAQKAVKSLPEREAQAVDLIVQDKSTVEIAQILGCSDSMVRRYLRQARTRLKSQLKEK